MKVARHKIVSNNSNLLVSMCWSDWIYGIKSPDVNSILWVVNFAIYKAML